MFSWFVLLHLALTESTLQFGTALHDAEQKLEESLHRTGEVFADSVHSVVENAKESADEASDDLRQSLNRAEERAAESGQGLAEEAHKLTDAAGQQLAEFGEKAKAAAENLFSGSAAPAEAQEEVKKNHQPAESLKEKISDIVEEAEKKLDALGDSLADKVGQPRP